MHITGWSKNLEVSADGQGVVSHAGLALLRHLADKTGLTAGLSKALASPRLLVHDRGRVTADLACAIADGAEVISDFRLLADQKELFGLVASVPTTWRTLNETAAGGPRALARVTKAVNAARRRAWTQIEARHGALPGVRIADKVLEGVTCIRLDATVTPAHSDKELAEPNYKGFGHHPLLGYCDNTDEPLAGVLRRGSAGPNTTADHLQVLGDAIAALPPKYRRRLMVTADGAGASHGLIARLDALASRRGHQLVYSVGWDLGERERTAIAAVPGEAWQIAVDHRGEIRERRAAATRRPRRSPNRPPAPRARSRAPSAARGGSPRRCPFCPTELRGRSGAPSPRHLQRLHRRRLHPHRRHRWRRRRGRGAPGAPPRTRRGRRRRICVSAFAGTAHDPRSPDWHPAPASVQRTCMKAAVYCKQEGSDLAKLAIQFSARNPQIATTLVGTADPDNLRRNLD